MKSQARNPKRNPKNFLIWILLLAMVSGCNIARAESNGVGITPPMGWSSWSFLRNNPTEANVKAQAAAMVSSGLASHGFVYCNLDDFYYLNPAQTVDANGRWVVDTTRFPDGMKALADYVHGLGLKFGMYITPGIPVAAYNQNTPIQGTTYHAQDIVTNTSSYEINYNFSFDGSNPSHVMYFIDFTKPGSQEFINSWAKLLASYGVDYVKMDGVGDSDVADIQAWSQALANSGRAIHFELSNSLDPANGATWKQYSNGWRTSGDIEDYSHGITTAYPLTNWNNAYDRFLSAPKFTPWAGPGGWNDLDSLEIGNGSNDGLTADERLTVMSLWCITQAPLILGTDLTALDANDMALLTNDEVIAVCQQGGGIGTPSVYNSLLQVWDALRADGTYTVALFNTSASASNTVTATWAGLGFSGQAEVRDLWSRSEVGVVDASFSATINPHGVRLLHVTPAIPVQRYTAGNPANTFSGGAIYDRELVGSDGYIARFVGNGGAVTFGGIAVALTGTYNITVRYSNGDSSTRSARLTPNFGTPVTVSFPSTGSWDNTRGTVTLALPLSAGTNAITFDNPSGYAPDFDSVAVQAQQATPIQQWRFQYFKTPANSGVAADTAVVAADGLNNLQKYAFGLNPLILGKSPITIVTNNGALILSTPKSGVATDLTWTVETTNDLSNPSSWTTTGVVIDQNTSTSLQAHVAVNGGARQFLRVRIGHVGN